MPDHLNSLKSEAATNTVSLYPHRLRGFALRMVCVRFTAAPGGTGRRIHVEICDKDGDRLFAMASDTNQGANSTRWYYGYDDAPLDHGPDEGWMFMPPTVLVPAGGCVRAFDENNIKPVGDQIYLAVQGALL